MDTRARKIALALMLLALAATMYLALTGGELLRTLGGDPERGEQGWMKPTTGILESMRGTATAEAAPATPEPQAEDAKQPGLKAAPRQSFEDWWFDQRFPNWGSA